jgi:hypothetical protein
MKFLFVILSVILTCPLVEAISLQGPRIDDLPTGVVYGIRISFHGRQRLGERADSVRNADSVRRADSINRTADSKLRDGKNGMTEYDNSTYLDKADTRRVAGNIRHIESLVYVTDSVLLTVDTVRVKPHLLRLKTNAVGWALLNGNIAVEYSFDDHWTVSLPVYYGALDYFTSIVKFRTHAILPELRYYTRLDEGLFVGVHAGICYYNFAIGGTTRFQDHNGKEPAIGGGFTAGYIMRLGKSRRWNVEFSLGAGVYRHHYDKFYNVKNGPKFASKTKTDIYVDNVSVSFSYTFDLTKRHAHR